MLGRLRRWLLLQRWNLHGAKGRGIDVRVFGEVRGIRKLAEAHFEADEIDGWELTQIAAYLLGADGVYRAPMDHLMVFMLLDNFRTEPPRRGPLLN